MTSGYREDIDWLRAIAVLSVVAFHFEAPAVYGGFVGVVPTQKRHPYSPLSVAKFFGQISYSLYLWHWPLFTFARFSKPGLVLEAGDKVALFAVAVIISYLSWRYIEQPFRMRQFAPSRGSHHVITPTIAPIRHVVSVPETIDFSPSELISSRRCGAMVPSPPIMMPRLPKLAKPHIA